jgi:hypothetical protein
MSRAIQKLTQLIAGLERGGDQLRLFAAKSTYHFKHSWIELADALVQVKNSGAFIQWGYDAFLSYCEGELGLKKALVDKLTVSFTTLEQYAPERLSGEAETPIPSYQSLDYFARAMGDPRFDGSDPRDAPQEPLSPELTGQLQTAVFEECCTHKQLKDRFDPLIRPKSDVEEQQESLRKVLTTTKRLQEQLESLDGLDADLFRESMDILNRLQAVMSDRKALLDEQLLSMLRG